MLTKHNLRHNLKKLHFIVKKKNLHFSYKSDSAMYKLQGKLQVTVFLLLNIIFSLIIILLNKWIYAVVQFPNITLSLLHFVVTYIGLYVFERFNLFAAKRVHLDEIVVLALSFCGFVVFTNLSLQNNTVGTFQVAKVLTTPGVLMIQMVFYGKYFSLPVKLTLVPIIVGIVLNFYYDLHFNVAGTVYALLGVIITSLYQVLVNKKQSELQMNSMQLLLYQAPLSAVFLCVCVPFIEPPAQTFSHPWTATELLMIAVSCLAALFCNLTTYWIIGNTSPLTYNMLGHSKFILVTLGGWFLFDATMTLYQWCGILMTLFGIVLYTHFKMKENSSARSQFVLLQGVKAT